MIEAQELEQELEQKLKAETELLQKLTEEALKQIASGDIEPVEKSIIEQPALVNQHGSERKSTLLMQALHYYNESTVPEVQAALLRLMYKIIETPGFRPEEQDYGHNTILHRLCFLLDQAEDKAKEYIKMIDKILQPIFAAEPDHNKNYRMRRLIYLQNTKVPPETFIKNFFQTINSPNFQKNIKELAHKTISPWLDPYKSAPEKSEYRFTKKSFAECFEELLTDSITEELFDDPHILVATRTTLSISSWNKITNEGDRHDPETRYQYAENEVIPDIGAWKLVELYKKCLDNDILDEEAALAGLETFVSDNAYAIYESSKIVRDAIGLYEVFSPVAQQIRIQEQQVHGTLVKMVQQRKKELETHFRRDIVTTKIEKCEELLKMLNSVDLASSKRAELCALISEMQSDSSLTEKGVLYKTESDFSKMLKNLTKEIGLFTEFLEGLQKTTHSMTSSNSNVSSSKSSTTSSSSELLNSSSSASTSSIIESLSQMGSTSTVSSDESSSVSSSSSISTGDQEVSQKKLREEFINLCKLDKPLETAEIIYFADLVQSFNKNNTSSTEGLLREWYEGEETETPVENAKIKQNGEQIISFLQQNGVIKVMDPPNPKVARTISQTSPLFNNQKQNENPDNTSSEQQQLSPYSTSST